MSAKSAVIDTCSLINLQTINNISLIKQLRYYFGTTVYVEVEIIDSACRDFLKRLERENLARRIELTIEDLVEMAKIPYSKRLSNGELSCYIKAKELNIYALSDDKKAIKYISRYYDINHIIGIKHFLEDAYLHGFLGEFEVKRYIEELAQNRFKIEDEFLINLIAQKHRS